MDERVKLLFIDKLAIISVTEPTTAFYRVGHGVLLPTPTLIPHNYNPID
jgi:hypothetical protein